VTGGFSFCLDLALSLDLFARVATFLPAIKVNGVTYRVLRLNHRGRGPRFILGNEKGQFFGLFPNYERTAFLAEPLDPEGHNPLERVEFHHSNGDLWTKVVEAQARS
jgi:hypothetical protein